MKRSRGAGGTIAGAGLLVVVAIAVVLLVKGLYPADLPENHNPDFVDIVFDNRGVIWAARLLLVAAAAVLAFGGTLVVLSIGIRMKKGEWLRRAGPFEISEEPFGRVEEEAGSWRRVALESAEEAARLRERLKHFGELFENL